MHHIELNEEKNINAKYFNRIIQEAENSSVIVVHNHPNNLQLSFQDIRLFYENDSIKAMVAIGNTENLYIIMDNNDEKKNRRRLYIDIIKYRFELVKRKLTNHQIDNELNKYILELLNDNDRLLLDYGFIYLDIKRKVEN